MGAAVLDTIEDDGCRLYAAVELGIAVAKTDPALAESCYRTAKATYDRSDHHRQEFTIIEGLGWFSDISLRIVALAGVLHKTADLDTMLVQLNTEVKKNGDSVTMIIKPLLEAAGRVSAVLVLKVVNSIDSPAMEYESGVALSALARHDVTEAQQLLKALDAAQGKSYMHYRGQLDIIRALGKTNPAAALALANTEKQTEILLEAARYQPPAEARKIVLDLFTIGGNQTIMNVAKASAIDPALGKELYTRYQEKLEAASYQSQHVSSEDGSTSGNRAYYAYMISSLDPVEARLILETEYARICANARHGGDKSMLPYFSQEMCAIDLTRAQEMIDDLNRNDNAKRFFQQQMMQYILMPREQRVIAY